MTGVEFKAPVPVQAVPALLDAEAVAALLSCSRRHVYAKSDGGLMPAPIKLGRLTRWRRLDIERWIEDGCPKPLPAA